MSVEGNLIGFKYNNTIYYYIKNMQEDIIGITLLETQYQLIKLLQVLLQLELDI